LGGLIPEVTATPLLWTIIGAAVLLLALLALFFVMRARARRLEEEEELDALSLEDHLRKQAQQQADIIEPGETESKAQAIRKLAKDEPESVASLLKTWLAEE